MKKLLTVLALIAFVGSSYAATTAGTSRIETYVNKKLAPITQKEKDLNAKAEANRKAAEARKAEAQKKQAEQKAAVERTKNNLKNTANATKTSVDNEVSFWKKLFGGK